MTIDKKILAKWQTLRSPEDTGKMAEQMDNGYPDLFSRAFRLGRCSDEVFQVMADFYLKKAELVKQYL